jgi:hypothetical protein
MALHDFDVKLPPELFIRATETKEPQVWTDDRGFTYEVTWSLEADKALAECVGTPGTCDVNDAWYRGDPAPEVRL